MRCGMPNGIRASTPCYASFSKGHRSLPKWLTILHHGRGIRNAAVDGHGGADGLVGRLLLRRRRVIQRRLQSRLQPAAAVASVRARRGVVFCLRLSDRTCIIIISLKRIGHPHPPRMRIAEERDLWHNKGDAYVQQSVCFCVYTFLAFACNFVWVVFIKLHNALVWNH